MKNGGYMKKFVHIMMIFLIISSCLFLDTNTALSVELPQKIRVGLYFKGSALSSFPVSAAMGLQFGFVSNYGFAAMYEESAGNEAFVSKDAFFTDSTRTAEFDPSAAVTLSGTEIGPFHLQIGTSYTDLAAVKNEVQALREKGICAYPVFAESWQVWTGFYLNEAAAAADIPNIAAKLGDTACNVVIPASNRIVVTNSSGEAVALFGSDVFTFKVCPKNENNPYAFKIKGKAYRGELEVIRMTGSDMTAINVLPLEEYLYGVVPSEIESYSHIDAQKAQAIIARTYAINNIKNSRFKAWKFDVDNTTVTQVYKGMDVETINSNRAVDETKGLVVTYNGSPAQVFYFASSGGRTEDVRNVWESSGIPYLVSVEDKYESGKSYNYNWETSFTPEKLKERMQSRGYDLGDILSVDVTKRSEAGRAIELCIKGTKGERLGKLERGCRVELGLSSQLYSIVTSNDTYVQGSNGAVKTQLSGRKVITASGIISLPINLDSVTVMGADNQKKTLSTGSASYRFVGKGWGHAVGLSQEGAKGMAQAGFTFEQILLHYFQGTKIE